MRMNPVRLSTVLAAGLIVSACSAAPPSPEPPGQVEPAESSEMAPPPAGASAKISPDMVGKVSPIPAFMGVGAGWTIDVQALDETRHRVALRWPARNEDAEGTAVYRDRLDVPRGTPLALDGKLKIGSAVKSVRLEIRTEACTDDAGIDHPQRVVVEIEGRPAMNGCGDLAVY